MVAKDFEEAPLWLTESYLLQVLRKYKKDQNLKLHDLIIEPATAKGENYASVMIRIKATLLMSSQDLVEESYLVKTSHEHDPRVGQIMEHYQPYTTEMLIYEKVLPQLQALLTEINDKDQLFAKTIHVDYEHSAIIFEDLSQDQYKLADRVQRLDEQHIFMGLKKIAKMHATAAVLNERQPNFLTKFDRGIFNQYTKGFRHFFEGTLEVAASYAGSSEALGLYYQQKLMKLKEKIMDLAAGSYKPEKEFFNTLNHGDFWTNNMLFSYQPENMKLIRDMKMIDFQFCSWSSPAVDLFYFINTSWQLEYKTDQRYYGFIKYYYDQLTSILEKLQFKGTVPTLKDFWRQLETKSFLAVPSALVCQALMINTDTEDADFNAMMEDNDRARRFKSVLYKNEKIQESVNKLLPLFDAKGLLDVNQ